MCLTKVCYTCNTIVSTHVMRLKHYTCITGVAQLTMYYYLNVLILRHPFHTKYHQAFLHCIYKALFSALEEGDNS